jgi:hypothetical protein
MGFFSFFQSVGNDIASGAQMTADEFANMFTAGTVPGLGGTPGTVTVSDTNSGTVTVIVQTPDKGKMSMTKTEGFTTTTTPTTTPSIPSSSNGSSSNDNNNNSGSLLTVSFNNSTNSTPPSTLTPSNDNNNNLGSGTVGFKS